MAGDARVFEQQVARLHRLLEADDSEVTWDDRVPDPDNPSQNRQIDITIRRAEGLTLVECRTHKAKQDVKWIEELIGRRQSLRADTVIAVSASGFTRGAVQKAKAFGVIVRDLCSLTEQEIQNWGRRTKVWICFDRFDRVTLRLYFDPELESQIDLAAVFDALRGDAGRLYPVFEKCASKIREHGETRMVGEFRGLLEPKDLAIAGHPVRMVYLEAEHTIVREERGVPSVMVYDAPDVDPIGRLTSIEKVDLGQFEIAQAQDEATLVIDLSAIEPPAKCKFAGVDFEFTRIVTVKAAEFVGTPPFRIALEDVSVELSFGDPSVALASNDKPRA